MNAVIGSISKAPTRAISIQRMLTRIRFNWPILGVLIAFAAAAFIIPTLTPVATTDDWGYSRSVEILHDKGDLTIFPVVAATAVFQVIWGYLFTSIFGMTLGVVRVSTIVMVGVGATALYGLLRLVGISAGRSALGAAIYLFNPLSFVLSYSFMTDPFLTALLIISTYLYVLGYSPSNPRTNMVILGAAVAGCAFLVRQQGALIPIGVVTYLVVSGRLGRRRNTVADLLRVAALPMTAAVGYLVWLRWFNHVPEVQQGFLNEARGHGVDGAVRLTGNLAFIELAYVGFFVLPLTAAMLPGLKSILQRLRWQGWLSLVLPIELVAIGFVIAGERGRRFPYVPQFVGAGGLGPPDVRGSRARIVHQPFFDYATLVCAISVVLVIVAAVSAVHTKPRSERSAIGLVAAIAAWQIVGIVPPSFHYMRRGYSLDRYLLPLLPFAICLVLWAARELPLASPVAWLVIAAYAAFSIAGTRDYLIYMGAVWDFAADTHASAVRYDQIDAGAAWDGYHLYTDGVDQGITRARTRNGPWWMAFYGKASDSTFIVTGKPQRGYITLKQRHYSSWLVRGDGVLYVQARPGHFILNWSDAP